MKPKRMKHDTHETLPPRHRLDTHIYTVLPIQLTRVSPTKAAVHRANPMPRTTRVMKQARARPSDWETVSEKDSTSSLIRPGAWLCKSFESYVNMLTKLKELAFLEGAWHPCCYFNFVRVRFSTFSSIPLSHCSSRSSLQSPLFGDMCNCSSYPYTTTKHR